MVLSCMMESAKFFVIFLSSTLNGSYTDRQCCSASSSSWRNLKCWQMYQAAATAVRSTPLHGNNASALCCSLRLWTTLTLTRHHFSFYWMTTSTTQAWDMKCTNLQESVWHMPLTWMFMRDCTHSFACFSSCKHLNAAQNIGAFKGSYMFTMMN